MPGVEGAEREDFDDGEAGVGRGERDVGLAVPSKAKLPIGQYLRENFYITTSGNFRTQTLTEVMLEVGADRILYSVDYPFEDMALAADWFDHAAISESDRLKIAGANARQLFHL